MGSDFLIKKTFVSSTAHIEADDIGILEGDTDIVTEDYEYGTRIYLSQNYYSSAHGESIIDHISKFSFSEGFKLIVLFAVSLNCDWLELDSDGPIYEEFPEYEW